VISDAQAGTREWGLRSKAWLQKSNGRARDPRGLSDDVKRFIQIAQMAY